MILFVDDMLIIGDDDEDVLEFKEELATKYELKDLGFADKFLGMKVTNTETGVKLSQESYTLDLLERFNMAGSNPIDTPASGNLAKELYRAEMRRCEGFEEAN